MTNRIETGIIGGTLISGTLRTEELLEAFSGELGRRMTHEMVQLRVISPTLVAEREAMIRPMIHRHMQLFREAKYMWRELPRATYIKMMDSPNLRAHVKHLVNDLQDALNEYAPDGMYFGTLEGEGYRTRSGADFGWWCVE